MFSGTASREQRSFSLVWMESLTTIRRGGIAPLLLLFGIYVATRKWYRLPDISIFIPKLPGTKIHSDSLISEIQNSFTFHFVTSPQIGWIATLKPIHGINIPFRAWLPWDIFVAIPQIRRQIGTNIVIKKKKVLGTVVGYKIEIKNVKFWA